MNKAEIQKAFDDLNKKYLHVLELLQEAYTLLDKKQEAPKTIEKVAGLREAAKMIVASEFNKEDLDEEEVYQMLQKASEEEVKKKLGFWAVPLPAQNKSKPSKVYSADKKQ